MNYHEFLEQKRHLGDQNGFAPSFMPDFLFDFQKALVDWSVRQGRAAMFADCGMGKTPMQLVWAQNIIESTNKPVLILTPLAVSQQTVREGEKFGIQAIRTRSANEIGNKGAIFITNYEQLHHFDPTAFAGVVCDESSCLKSHKAVRRSEITRFMRKMRYRLLCTATAAPNDYLELGTSSEALGYLGHIDMLNRFFKNDRNNSATGRMYGEVIQWRLKHHAEEMFWRWICSWARAVRKPSDLGFDDGDFHLPPLVERENLVEAHNLADGMLFDMPAQGLREQREEQRRTIKERCERMAEVVDHDQQALLWCHLNDEGNLLKQMIPDAVQVAGADSDEVKEERFLAFASGEIRALITKPKIGAWGLNFQNCAHVAMFPSHSFEQYYQAVRRCWRFGQTKEVVVDMVMTEGGRGVFKNLQSKARAADKMFSRLVELMNDSMQIKRSDQFTDQEQIPTWL